MSGGTASIAHLTINQDGVSGGYGGVGGLGGAGGIGYSGGSAGNGGKGGSGGRAGYSSISGHGQAYGGNGGQGGNDGNGGYGGSGGAGGQGGAGGKGGLARGGGFVLLGGSLTLNADTIGTHLINGGHGGAGGGGGQGGTGYHGGFGGGIARTTTHGGVTIQKFNQGGNAGTLGSGHGVFGPGFSNQGPSGGRGGNGGNGGHGGNGGTGGTGGSGGSGGDAVAGAAYIKTGSLTVYNSTFAANEVAAGQGGTGGLAGAGGSIRKTSHGGPVVARGGPGATGGSGYVKGASGQAGSSGVAGSLGAPGKSGASAPSGSSQVGGLYITGGAVTMYNATIAQNQTGGVMQSGGTVTLVSTLVAGNGAVDYSNHGGTAAASYSLFQVAPTGVTESHDQDNVNPLLDSKGLQSNGGPTQTIAIVSAASPANGNGANPLHLFTDQRGYTPAAAWGIGAYQYGAQQAAAPTATLAAPNVTVADYGGTTYTFTITYSSAAGIKPATLANPTVLVTPPGGVGAPIVARMISAVPNGPTDPFGDAQSFTVTYSITPPGGAWSSADNGTYAVSLSGQPVTDSNGTPVASGVVGSFEVETADIQVVRFGLIHNHATNEWNGTIRLINRGTSAFTGPIYLVLENLSAGVTLENASGADNGMPYLKVAAGTVAPGQAVMVVLRFNTALVQYNPVLYLGALGA